jgi:hypothetical protein
MNLCSTQPRMLPSSVALFYDTPRHELHYRSGEEGSEDASPRHSNVRGSEITACRHRTFYPRSTSATSTVYIAFENMKVLYSHLKELLPKPLQAATPAQEIFQW